MSYEKYGSNHPRFAVVGRPNKGKSSIVSSLSLDDTVQISDTPGTTKKRRSFPLEVDGKIIYELFDTPGFQRARNVLEWLENHDVSANKKHEVVREFIEEFRDDPKYNDEIELLEPIMDGAGIIYVVDGSNQYNEKYEAEMKILLWTGQPSMALINHIDDGDYTQEWKRALHHYFKIVRVYNPMNARMEQHISILESMAQLKEEWTQDVKSSISFVEDYYLNMIKRSSLIISKALYISVSKVEKLYFNSITASDKQKIDLESNYKDSLRNVESSTQKEIEIIWNHDNLEKDLSLLQFSDMDLFSEESASVFGLTKKELIITAAGSGAIAGAGIDLVFAGTTLFLGSALGAIGGGVGALFAFNELSEIKVLGQSIGKHYLEIGPMDNRNFPYILLGRLIYHTEQIAKRSHAKRDIADFEMNSTFKDKWLDANTRKSLEPYHKKFRSGKTLNAEVFSEYEELIYSILKKLL